MSDRDCGDITDIVYTTYKKILKRLNGYRMNNTPSKVTQNIGSFSYSKPSLQWHSLQQQNSFKRHFDLRGMNLFSKSIFNITVNSV